MAVVNTPVFAQTASIGVQSFLNADASTKKTIITAGANGSRVVALSATSTETAADRLAQVWLVRSSVAYLLTSVNVLRNSGFDGIAPNIDLLNQTIWPGMPFGGGAGGFDGQSYIFLQASDLLQVSFTTAITAGKEIDIVGIFSNF
jgi:hypothetical protein